MTKQTLGLFFLFCFFSIPAFVPVFAASEANLSPDFHTMRALLERGDYALAAQVEGPWLVTAAPLSGEAHYLYAQALFFSGDLSAARASLAEASMLAPETPEHWALEGRIEAAEGNLERARVLLERTLALSPSYRVAMDLGRVLWQAGDFAAAAEAYQVASRTERGRLEPWPLLHQARLLALLAEHTEAIGLLERALELLEASDSGSLPSPAYAEAFYRLGLAFEALGNPAEAVANFEAAALADPNFFWARQAAERLRASR